MPSACAYRMCHNLASSTWGGYCNEAHYKRGMEDERAEKNQQTTEQKILESLQRIEDLLNKLLERSYAAN